MSNESEEPTCTCYGCHGKFYRNETVTMTEHIADDTAHLYRHCEYELCPSCWGIIQDTLINLSKTRIMMTMDHKPSKAELHSMSDDIKKGRI